MPNLSELLHDTTADDIVDVQIPEGYWSGVIRYGKLYETDRDGGTLTDKNGAEYARAVIFVQCNEPIDGVDPAAADTYLSNDGPNETMARYSQFIRGGRDVKKLMKQLEGVGALTAGRPLDKILEELKGAGVPVKVLIEHEEYNDEIQDNAVELAAV